jgi:hypothetical protein
MAGDADGRTPREAGKKNHQRGARPAAAAVSAAIVTHDFDTLSRAGEEAPRDIASRSASGAASADGGRSLNQALGTGRQSLQSAFDRAAGKWRAKTGDRHRRIAFAMPPFQPAPGRQFGQPFAGEEIVLRRKSAPPAFSTIARRFIIVWLIGGSPVAVDAATQA